MNLTNIDCVGHNELYKNNRTPTGVQFEIGDCIELDYIKSYNFTPNVGIGEPKVSADEGQNTNYSDSAYIDTHDESNHGLFCVTEKDLDLIDIDDLY